MFKTIIRKTRIKQLNDKYLKLMRESFVLSHTDRIASDRKRLEAERIMKKLEEKD